MNNDPCEKHEFRIGLEDRGCRRACLACGVNDFVPATGDLPNEPPATWIQAEFWFGVAVGIIMGGLGFAAFLL